MRKNILIVIIFVAISVLSGCARYSIHERQLDAIELGMNQDDLKNELGAGLRRGSIKNREGQTVEVWEYKIKKTILAKLARGARIVGGTAFAGMALVSGAPERVADAIFHFGTGSSKEKEPDKYWLYLIDGRLVGWGQAGDWNEAQNQIPYIHFKTVDNLSSVSTK